MDEEDSTATVLSEWSAHRRRLSAAWGTRAAATLESWSHGRGQSTRGTVPGHLGHVNDQATIGHLHLEILLQSEGCQISNEPSSAVGSNQWAGNI